jgi:hypothetical protein
MLYFIFTLFIEYFLWLKPMARTMLFWLFVLVEISLLTKFVIFPVLKLIGLRKGISFTEASKLIGRHFKEVDDKLLNILQLNNDKTQTDLLLASIEQKAIDLKPIPFRSAINFKTNYKYLKYLAIPVIIWSVVFLTGNNSFFTQSINRVIHHSTAYNPPAPFNFKILNKGLRTNEGKAFSLQVTTVGSVIPENIKIILNNEIYYLNKSINGEFLFEFENPVNNVDFYFEANNIISNTYTLEVLSTPKMVDFLMKLTYPDYTNMESEIIENTGNATIPQGTEISWNIKTKNTDLINFITFDNERNPSKLDQKQKSEKLLSDQKQNFHITKRINKSFAYQINTSNENIENYEEMNYHLEVVKDKFPKIIVKSDIDSVSRGPVQFIGQLSDDYGISKLQVIAKNAKTNVINIHNIGVNHKDLEEFYYVFPRGFSLQEGTGYEIYFEVFDNDAINGKKKTVSQRFYYNNKTQDQIDSEILMEQKQSIDDMESNTRRSDDLQKSLDNFSKKLKSKNNTDWNDKKELDQFLERQKKYDQMLKKNADNLLQNLEEMDTEEDMNLEEKKHNLEKRIKESKELQEKEDLLKELEELAEKLKKEDLLDKIDKLKEHSKQEKRSLERILELTKRFYVEKKSSQIIKKLDQLSKEQNELSNSENNKPEEQEKLNKKYDSIQKDFDELNKQNDDLKQPMQLKDTKADQKLIEMEMNKALDNLEKSDESPNKKNNNSKEGAKKNQKSAAKKMKELSEKMEDSFMQMEMESNEENMEDLKQILENLLIFSFDQEKLMLSFTNITSKNAEYPEKLKEQIKLKEYFEHIDDSLYTLSLRLVRLSSTIQEDLTDAHYNLDKSLENIAENRISDGISNQHYTMTSVNNLADLLSDILQSMQNRKPGSGKGKGKKGEELSLPDIIKKQGEMVNKLKQEMEQGNKKGNKSKEQMSGEQFEIYQEQNRLKEQLKNLLKKGSSGSQSKKVLQQMDELEKLLLEKGISNETLRNMQKLEYELLKLENASFDQNKDTKRKSNSSEERFMKNYISPIKGEKIYFKEDEILIRNYLDLHPDYQKRIKKYYEKKEL